MRSFTCTVCGYVYREEQGIPEAGIAPGTSWDELPNDWACPLCGATKAEFQELGAANPAPKPRTAMQLEASEDLLELTPLQISALCSNLARGCEKQYKIEEAKLFHKLSTIFKDASPHADAPDMHKLLSFIENDLSEDIPRASELSFQAKDRGALRALAWNEKVSKILKSLLTRYQREGDSMLENTGVFVCVICGFVYVGDEAPLLCPVCKAPNWKLEKVEGRAS